MLLVLLNTMDVTLTYSVWGVVYDCVHLGTYVQYTYVEVKGQPQVVLTFLQKKKKRKKKHLSS